MRYAFPIAAKSNTPERNEGDNNKKKSNNKGQATTVERESIEVYRYVSYPSPCLGPTSSGQCPASKGRASTPPPCRHPLRYAIVERRVCPYHLRLFVCLFVFFFMRIDVSSKPLFRVFQGRSISISRHMPHHLVPSPALCAAAASRVTANFTLIPTRTKPIA
eukprot:gene283-156_t